MSIRHFQQSAAAVICGLCFVLTTAGVEAKDVVRPDRTAASKLDDKMTGSNLRASQLIGMNIQNPQQESVGEVSDIVLDADTGRIRYLAVTYGGFLGLGNKMFAVPYAAFEFRQDPDDRDEYLLVLDVTQERLEGAEGFDEDHWPNFGDRNFTNELDKRYGVDRKRPNRDVDVKINRDGVDVNVDTPEKKRRED